MSDAETMELINRVVAKVCDTVIDDINQMQFLNIGRIAMSQRLVKKLESVKASPVKLQEDVGDIQYGDGVGLTEDDVKPPNATALPGSDASA